jgi:hypothetical protein
MKQFVEQELTELTSEMKNTLDDYTQNSKEKILELMLNEDIPLFVKLDTVLTVSAKEVAICLKIISNYSNAFVNEIFEAYQEEVLSLISSEQSIQ